MTQPYPARKKFVTRYSPPFHEAETRQALDELIDAELIAKDTRIVKLEKFVEKFLDNFEDCNLCELGLDAAGQICSRCEGTEKQIDSRGVLFVELPEEARALLKGKQP